GALPRAAVTRAKNVATMWEPIAALPARPVVTANAARRAPSVVTGSAARRAGPRPIPVWELIAPPPCCYRPKPLQELQQSQRLRGACWQPREEQNRVVPAVQPPAAPPRAATPAAKNAARILPPAIAAVQTRSAALVSAATKTESVVAVNA